MLGQALKLVREFHKIKQKELAVKLEISPSFLSEVETGQKQVTIELLEKYSKAFSIPSSSLLYFAEAKDDLGDQKRASPIAAKAIMMLDWVAMITHEDERDEKMPDRKISPLPTKKQKEAR